MKSNDRDEQSEDGMVIDSKTCRKSATVQRRKTRLTKKVCTSLCEDLIAEIFARLPLKSVIRMRCLSKSWYFRIASPDFIRMYTLVRTLNTPEKVLIQHLCSNCDYIYTLHSKDMLPLRPIRRGYIPYMDVTPVQFPAVQLPFAFMDIIGSCNGIVCVYGKRVGFILWNFSVRRQVQIPDPPFMRVVQEGCKVSLGFGFDSVTHDYKIVGILAGENTSFIYSLKTNSWSEIDFPSSTTRFYGNQRACFLDGALHWVETRYLDETKNFCEYIILTFSLNSHVFGTIPLPEPSRKAREVYRHDTREIRIVDGCLALISTDTYTLSYIKIWVMREYGNVSSWSMVNEFDICKQFNGVGIKKLLPNGGLLLHKRETNENEKVYHPKTGLGSEVLKFKETCCEVDTETYVESLEFLDKGTPCGETIFWEKKKRETISKGRRRGKKRKFGS